MQVAVKQLQRAVTALGVENSALNARLACLAAAPDAGSPNEAAAGDASAAAAERVERLQVERSLLRAICKLAVAIATDQISGVFAQSPYRHCL